MMTIDIERQPDDSTCGPTCLQAAYRFFKDDLPLQEVIDEVHTLEMGGTLGVFLAMHALSRGYDVTIHSWNLKVFDPTWKKLPADEIQEKLRLRIAGRSGRRFRPAAKAYIAFLKAGGRLRFDDLSPELLDGWFARDIPILAGLSATYLYDCAREIEGTDGRMIFDDVGGEPSGHFVLLGGRDRDGRVRVNDPYPDNPVSGSAHYLVDPIRLVNSIMLGIVTYDANLVMIQPRT